MHAERALKERVLAWGLLAAAVAVFFLPFLAQGRVLVPFQLEWGSVTGIPGGGDPAAVSRPDRWPASDTSPITIHYPDAALAHRALARGELPTWNPFVGCGQPALGNGQVYPFSPFLWSFYLWPGPEAYTFGLLLGTLWAAAGVSLWLGRLDFPPWQRALGAALLVLNPWTVRIIVYSNVWAAWWLGWLLWAWEIVLARGGRRWWLPAPFIAGMVYCGHPETALLLAAASALYAAVAWFSRNREDREAAFWWKAAGAVALAGALTAVHWLPVLMHLPETLPYKFLLPELATREHYTLASLASPATEVYVSPALCGLIFAGLPLALARRRLWPSAALLALAVLVLFHPVPIGLVNRALTLGGILPPRYGRDFWWFALAPLAVLGAGRLWTALPGERGRAVAWFGLGLLPYAAWAAWDALKGGGGLSLLRPVWIATAMGLFLWILLGAWVVPGRLRPAFLALGFLFLCLDPFVLFHGDLQSGTPYAFARRSGQARFSYWGDAKGVNPVPASLAGLKARLDGDHGRFLTTPLPDGTPSLSPDLAALWGVRDVRVTDALLGRRYSVLQESFQGTGHARTFTSLLFPAASPEELGLLGVGRLGRPLDFNGARFAWQPVPSALPRAFLTHRVVAARDEEDSFRLWNQLLTEGRLHEETIVEGWTGPEEVGEAFPLDRVDWLEDGLSTVRLKVASKTGGVLILLDTFAEGWQARVDGGRVPILPANLAFRAVAVPLGPHEVEFHYEPASVRDGLALSACGWLALAGLAVAGRRRRVP